MARKRRPDLDQTRVNPEVAAPIKEMFDETADDPVLRRTAYSIAADILYQKKEKQAEIAKNALDAVKAMRLAGMDPTLIRAVVLRAFDKRRNCWQR